MTGLILIGMILLVCLAVPGGSDKPDTSVVPGPWVDEDKDLDK